jgi:hypothetical protein
MERHWSREFDWDKECEARERNRIAKRDVEANVPSAILRMEALCTRQHLDWKPVSCNGKKWKPQQGDICQCLFRANGSSGVFQCFYINDEWTHATTCHPDRHF